MGNAAGMADGDATLALPRRLDLGSVRELAGCLEQYQDADLTIDAGQVDHLGALGAQLLLAGRRQWRGRGLRLTISPRSAAFDDALRVLGLEAAFAEDAA